MLNRKEEDLTQLFKEAESQLRHYEQQVEYLKADQDKLKSLKIRQKDLKTQLKAMRQNETQFLDLVSTLRGQLNRPKASQETQTVETGLQYEQRTREWHSENVELRDMLIRQSQDVDRLIEEKRDLEELVEQQNQSIKQIRQMNTSIASIGGMYATLKENVNRGNLSSIVEHASTHQDKSQDLMSKIMQEKESYIGKLEQELSEMRKDCDQLREKLLQYEL